jgi:hypothetical protein
MISSTDLHGRLRLLRYGLIVLVVVTFLVSLLAPYVAVRPYVEAAGGASSVTDFLGTAVLYSVIVAVLAVVVYFVYQNILQRTIK